MISSTPLGMILTLGLTMGTFGFVVYDITRFLHWVITDKIFTIT